MIVTLKIDTPKHMYVALKILDDGYSPFNNETLLILEDTLKKHGLLKGIHIGEFV